MRDKKITGVKKASEPGRTMRGPEGVRWEEYVAVKDFEKSLEFVRREETKGQLKSCRREE